MYDGFHFSIIALIIAAALFVLAKKFFCQKKVEISTEPLNAAAK